MLLNILTVLRNIKLFIITKKFFLTIKKQLERLKQLESFIIKDSY
jgi:hypothetical protein